MSDNNNVINTFLSLPKKKKQQILIHLIFIILYTFVFYFEIFFYNIYKFLKYQKKLLGFNHFTKITKNIKRRLVSNQLFFATHPISNS